MSPTDIRTVSPERMEQWRIASANRKKENRLCPHIKQLYGMASRLMYRELKRLEDKSPLTDEERKWITDYWIQVRKISLSEGKFIQGRKNRRNYSPGGGGNNQPVGMPGPGDEELSSDQAERLRAMVSGSGSGTL